MKTENIELDDIYEIDKQADSGALYQSVELSFAILILLIENKELWNQTISTIPIQSMNTI